MIVRCPRCEAEREVDGRLLADSRHGGWFCVGIDVPHDPALMTRPDGARIHPAPPDNGLAWAAA